MFPISALQLNDLKVESHEKKLVIGSYCQYMDFNISSITEYKLVITLITVCLSV